MLVHDDNDYVKARDGRPHRRFVACRSAVDARESGSAIGARERALHKCFIQSEVATEGRGGGPHPWCMRHPGRSEMTDRDSRPHLGIAKGNAPGEEEPLRPPDRRQCKDRDTRLYIYNRLCPGLAR